MHNNLIQDLATILIVGSLFGWIFKKIFKLPMTIGYLFSGILIHLPVSYTPAILDSQMTTNLSEVGILMLLFSMGLHFGLRKIKTLGFPTLFVAVAQLLSVWFTAKITLTFIGLSYYQALFVGAAVCCSATSVIVKTIEDFQLKTHRFSEKLMGTLLIEDCVAIFILIFLTTLSSNRGGSVPVFKVGSLFLGSLFLWWLLGTILVPRLVRMAFSVGKEELLVALSVGLALGLAFLSAHWGFSPALGAFMMGSILSECRELKKIEFLIEPIKNLFALVFFVSVGLLFSPHILVTNTKIIFVLVLIVVLGKFIFNIVFNVLAGRPFSDSIRMGGSMGQIGELSFVIAQVGKSLGLLNESLFSCIVAVSVITMILTPFVLRGSLYLAKHVPCGGLSLFERYYQYWYLPSSSKRIFKKGVLGFIMAKILKNYRRATEHNTSNVLNRLAPWDEYLVPVTVEFGTEMVGKNLKNLKLREEFHVNVVAIERDMQVIISPKPTEVIMGGDSLLLYGDETSIFEIELKSTTPIIIQQGESIEDCILGRVPLTAKHKFVNKTILELGLRENYNCTVLAVNREGKRIKNPLSSFEFNEDDLVFIFGTRQNLAKLAR